MSWQDQAIPGTPDNIGVATEPVPVGKTSTGVKAALANSPADDATDARLEASAGRSEYDYEIGRLKPPRSPAEAQAQSDLRAFTPASGTPSWQSDAIPTWQANAVPGAAPAVPPRPPPEPSITQKVVGGIEAGLNIITALTTGNPGAAYQPTTQAGKQYTGIVQGGLEAGLSLATGAAAPFTAPIGAAGRVLGETAAKTATILDRSGRMTPDQIQQAQALQQSPVPPEQAGGLNLPAPPADQPIANALSDVTYQPRTPQGQDIAEAVGEPLNAVLPALGGHLAELGGVHEAAAPVTRMVGDAGRAGSAAVADTAAAAAQGVGKMVGVDPELAKVAQIAQDLPYPIKVAPDQVMGSKAAKAVGNVSREVPLSGSSTHDNVANFTRNVIDILNPDETADRLTPQTYADAMNRSGQGIGDIAAKTPVPLEDIAGALDDLRDHVNAKHSPETVKTVLAYIDDLQDAADDNGMIDGTKLKSINSEIGERIRSEAGSPLGGQLDNLQDIIQDGVEKNIADPADLKALKDYRRQYAYGKILQPIVAKTLDGLVSPSSLMAAVTRTGMGKNLMALGKGGAIGDLAKVGQLIKEPGGSSLVRHGVAAGVLGGIASVEPHVAGASIIGANIYNRLGPKVTRAMVGKRPPPEVPPGPPPEPTTSPGAGGGGGGAPPAGPGPLGDLTPDWTTTAGAGGGPPRGGNEPGLVPSIDETPPTTGNRKAPLQVPAVPGRPDLPDTLVSGGPAETAATEPSNAAMGEPGAIEARRQQGEAARSTPAPGPSIAEAQRLLAENPSPEVRAVLEQHIEAAKQAARDRAAQEENDAKAAQLERTARTTLDPVIQKKLLDQADALRGAERIAVGQTAEGQPEIPSGAPTKPLPVGKAIEGEPAAERVPAGKAAERPMTEDEWKTQFKLGDQDAERAKAVAQALQHDPEAVEKAVVQHENSPRAFDRVIQEINDANETEPAAGGSEGVPGAAPGTSAPVRPGSPEGAAPVSDQPAGSAVSAAERGAEGVAQPEPAAAVRAADEHAGADGLPEAGRGGVQADRGSGQGAGEQQGTSGAGVATIVRTTNEPAEGRVYHVKIGDDPREFPINRGDAGLGSPTWMLDTADHWKQGPAQSQNGFVSTYLGDTKAEALKNLPDVVKRLDASPGYAKEQPNDTTAAGPAEPSDLRGQGQTPLKGELSDEAFQAAEQEKAPFANPEALEAHLRDQLGNKLIDGLQAQGLLRIANSLDEGKKGAGGIMRQPNFPDIENMQGTHATLYYNEIGPHNAAGVLMHELGEHFGVIRLLGKDRYATLLKEVKQFEKSDDPELKQAWQDVKDRYVGPDTLAKISDTDHPDFLREVAARLVETKPDLPFVRRLVNDIRVYFYTHFGTTLGTSVDAGLIRGLAASALRKAAAGEFKGQTATAAKPAKTFTPMVAKARNDGFPPLFQ